MQIFDVIQDGNPREFKSGFLERLSAYNEEQQAGYVANPFMQYLIDSYMAQILANRGGVSVTSTTSTTTTTTTTTTTNSNTSNTSNISNKQNKKSEPEPEPDDDVTGGIFDLFD